MADPMPYLHRFNFPMAMTPFRHQCRCHYGRAKPPCEEKVGYQIEIAPILIWPPIIEAISSGKISHEQNCQIERNAFGECLDGFIEDIGRWINSPTEPTKLRERVGEEIYSPISRILKYIPIKERMKWLGEFLDADNGHDRKCNWVDSDYISLGPGSGALLLIKFPPYTDTSNFVLERDVELERSEINCKRQTVEPFAKGDFSGSDDSWHGIFDVLRAEIHGGDRVPQAFLMRTYACTYLNMLAREIMNLQNQQ